MPRVQASPTVQPPISQPKSVPSLAQQTKAAVKAASLDSADAYVRSSSQWDVFLFEGYNSYRSTQKAMVNQSEGLDQWVRGADIGHAVKRGAIQRTVTSGLRNGWGVVQGKITLSEAGGRMVGDVSSAAVGSGVGAVVAQAAVHGISKVSGNPLVVKFGSMAAGWAANYGTRKVLSSTGVQQAITHQTTQLLQKAGVK